MACPIAHFVVSLGVDGRIVSQGSVSDALARNKNLVTNIAEDKKVMKKANEEIDPKEPKDQVAKGDGKLTVAEEIQEGHVSWKALKLFFVGLGGDRPFIFWVVFLGGLFSTDIINTIQTWWLGFWASQYDQHKAYEVDVPLWVITYTLHIPMALTYDS
jgi:hypothetical protein